MNMLLLTLQVPQLCGCHDDAVRHGADWLVQHPRQLRHDLIGYRK